MQLPNHPRTHINAFSRVQTQRFQQNALWVDQQSDHVIKNISEPIVTTEGLRSKPEHIKVSKQNWHYVQFVATKDEHIIVIVIVIK